MVNGSLFTYEIEVRRQTYYVKKCNFGFRLQERKCGMHCLNSGQPLRFVDASLFLTKNGPMINS